MSRPIPVLLALAATSFQIRAATVAFLKLRDNRGAVVRLGDADTGGAGGDSEFAHVAVRYGARWVHAYPGRPVEIITGLGGLSREITYLHHPDVPPPTRARIEPWLGRAFDRAYGWDRADGIYCSRFAAELVDAGIAPTPMRFHGETWRHSDDWPRGAVGLGPNKLFAGLKRRGWREINPCGRALEAIGEQFPIKYVRESSIWEDASQTLPVGQRPPRVD